jgi:hypothetical protein
MLKMLKLPSSTTLYLNCKSKNTSTRDDSEGPLLAIISAQFQTPIPVEFKSLTVAIRHYMGGLESLKITASTFPSTLRNRQTGDFERDIDGNAELVLSFDIKHGFSTDLLEQACKILPISNLESISMSTTRIIDINWVEIFSCCTNVTSVQVHGASGLVRALTAPTVTNAVSNKRGRKRKHDNRESTLVQTFNTVVHADATIFPKLKVLGLTELDFFEGDGPSGTLFDVFERGLQQRTAASGVPLKLLRISDCIISTEHANDLHNLVQDLHWDENEGLSDESEDFDDDEEPLYAPWEHGFVRRGWHSNWWDIYADSDSDEY